MARFQSVYSDEQRLAILRAVEAGMSHRGAAAAANAGELGMPAFGVSPASVSGWVREDQEDREQRESARAKPETVAKTVHQIVAEQLYVVRRASKRNAEAARRGKPDPDEAARIARAARDIANTARAIDPGSNASRSNGHGKAPDAPAKAKRAPGLLERLAAAERAGSPGQSNA